MLDETQGLDNDDDDNALHSGLIATKFIHKSLNRLESF